MQEFKSISTLLTGLLPSAGEVPVGAQTQRRLEVLWSQLWAQGAAGGRHDSLDSDDSPPKSRHESPHLRLAESSTEPAAKPPFSSQPLLFTSGRLVVFVESAAWGNEIRHQSQYLRDALARHGMDISTIEVKVRPLA